MTKFEIKAIRFCAGYNTDLRVKFPTKQGDKNADSIFVKTIADFLLQHRIAIFSVGYWEKLGLNSDWSDRPEQFENDMKIYDYMLKCAREICNGVSDD